jgi:phospholipid/cholesterol/gamma-HCH transport system substrate-binding protein
MKMTGAQKTKIGLFSLLGIVILGAGIYLIGNNRNMFTPTFTIYGTFRNVGGLQIGNNVRFVGINVGTVQNIEIVSDTMARVDMRLEAKLERFLRSNAVASIGSDGLMGDKLIIISAVPDSNRSASPSGQLSDGSKIKTVDPVDVDRIISKLTKVADNAEIITTAFAGIVTKVNNGKGSLGRMLNSDTLERSLEGTIRSAHSTMSSIKDNSDALHHNFLLRGFFKKKAKKQAEAAAKAKADSAAAAQHQH